MIMKQETREKIFAPKRTCVKLKRKSLKGDSPAAKGQLGPSDPKNRDAQIFGLSSSIANIQTQNQLHAP